MEVAFFTTGLRCAQAGKNAMHAASTPCARIRAARGTRRLSMLKVVSGLLSRRHSHHGVRTLADVPAAGGCGNIPDVTGKKT
jgi:hypothetical protein